VIDVAALDSHTLEQHEYQDRVTHYTQRLNGLAVMQRWRAPSTRVCILADLPNPEKLLSTNGVHPNDLQMVLQNTNLTLEFLKVSKCFFRWTSSWRKRVKH
jgi:ragulator complex protein LAMTOR1